MALDAGDGDVGGEGAATADLDRVAEGGDGGRLADEADSHGFALAVHPVEECHGPVGGVALLVAGDGQEDGGVGGQAGDHGGSGCGEGGDAGLHVGGAPAPELIVADLRAEGVDAPAGHVAGGDDVGMASEAEGPSGALGAGTGEEVGDAAPVDAGASKAGAGEDIFEEDERAGVERGDRGAADQRRREGERVEDGGWRDGIGHREPRVGGVETG